MRRHYLFALILAFASAFAPILAHASLPGGGAPVPTCDPRQPNCCKTVGLCRW